jgi:hypothetical protein
VKTGGNRGVDIAHHNLTAKYTVLTVLFTAASIG